MLVARRAAAAARGAREIITDRRGASEVAEKGVHDFVTATDRAFVAARGEGAYLGDERLHVSDVDYSEAIMAVGTMPYDKSDSDRLFRMWHRIFLETNDLRRIGAAASDIVRVAAGKIEGYCEKRLGTWDYAAASLILTEAGGVFSGWHGERVVMDGVKRSVVAATPRTHERLLRVIEEEYFN